MEQPKAVREIVSSGEPWHVRLRELWGYRDLILILARRRLTVRYKQTVLGPLWLLIYPLLTSLVHLLVFGVVAEVGTDGVPMILFYLAGSSIWAFLSYVTEQCSNTFHGNAFLFGRVYFPRLCVPLSELLTAVSDFGIRLLLLLGMSVLYSAAGKVRIPYLHWLLLPFVLLWLGLLSLGLGLVICAFTTRYRDLKVLVGFGLQLWMYITPVVYPASRLEGTFLAPLVLWNPAAAPVCLFRRLLFGTPSPAAGSVLVSLLLTAGILLWGLWSFGRAERTFMDTI